jgi:hypothetical protein
VVVVVVSVGVGAGSSSLAHDAVNTTIAVIAVPPATAARRRFQSPDLMFCSPIYPDQYQLLYKIVWLCEL